MSDINLSESFPAPAPMSEEAIKAIIDSDGKSGVVTGVRIVVTDEGSPAVQFIVLTSDGEVTAIPSNAGAYLAPLNVAYVGKKATVVSENGIASFLSISDENASF
jgi:hypothetical protein